MSAHNKKYFSERGMDGESSTSEIVPYNRSIENSIETNSSIGVPDVFVALRSTIETNFPNWLEICNDNHQMRKFWELIGDFLRKFSDAFENRSRKDFINISSILKNLRPVFSDKYKALEKSVAKWKPNRETLIQKLSDRVNEMDNNVKWFSIARSCSAAMDIGSSITGLLFRSDTELAGYAFDFATLFGLCGFFFTFMEVEESKRILNAISEDIETDHKLLSSIIEWFKDTEELDLVVQELFPHGIDKKIIHEIQASSADLEDRLKVFKAAFRSNVQKDKSLYHNAGFLCTIQVFACSEVASLWWNRIIHRKHPLDVDLGKVALETEFGQMQTLIFQTIPALPLEQQRLSSLPIAGRMMLNLMTIYDSYRNLRGGAKSRFSDKLRKQLSHLKSELENIQNTVERMKNHQP